MARLHGLLKLFIQAYRSTHMAKASARHLLVSDEQTCLDLKKQIQDGADFGEVAKNTPAAPPDSAAVISVNSAPARWFRNLIPLCSMKQLGKFTAR